MKTASTRHRRGNALLLSIFVLAMVVTGTMAITDQLLGRQLTESQWNYSANAQNAANATANMLADSIYSNSSLLVTDFSGSTGANPLSNWLTRGYLSSPAAITTTPGLWLNGCLVYWRLEPVVAYNTAVTTTNTSDTVISNGDITQSGGTNYMVNQTYDANAVPAPLPVGTSVTNPGMLFFEMTVDAYAMTGQNNMSTNPVAVVANIAGASQGDRAMQHVQVKKRVLVKSLSLFRYVIFYNASGPTGDLELWDAPNINVVGAVHTNGAAYLCTDAGVGVLGSSPAVANSAPTSSQPPLQPISFGAVGGIFCMVKSTNYAAGLLDPMAISRSDPVNANGAAIGSNYPYLNNAQLTYTSTSVGGYALETPVQNGTYNAPFTVARDSRQNTGGTPLSGYDPSLVRDGPNSGLKVINIATALNIAGYNPLEPFALMKSGVPVRGTNGSYSVTTGTATSISACDMMLFQINATTQDILPTQGGYSGDIPVPANTLNAIVPAPTAAAVVAFNTTTIPLPGGLVPPVSCHTSNCVIDTNDIFSNIATYIQSPIPAMSPVVNTYIRNPLGLNQSITPGVGLVILERGKQAQFTSTTASWPSGRSGHVSWEPPTIYSTNDVNTGLGSRYYDVHNAGVIDSTMTTKFLWDYCQWLRSNYAVYFGVNSAGQLVDITDQFFSIPTGTVIPGTSQAPAALTSLLLACENTFKDKRESRWWQSAANNYISTSVASYDGLYVNVLDLNIGKIGTFIATTLMTKLDPTWTGSATTLAYQRPFNGTIYVARTPRFSLPATPAAAPTGASSDNGNGFIGMSTANLANMYTYRKYGEFSPVAPLGFNPLMTGLTAYQQRKTLPAVMLDTLSASAVAPLYPAVGDPTQASLNGYSGLPNVAFGASSTDFATYPNLKRVRLTNASTISWGGTAANGRTIGLTIYTPDSAYLLGNFDAKADPTGFCPVCALYCGGLTALSNAWTDANTNAITGTAVGNMTSASSTVDRLCVVLHNTPTDLSNVSSVDVWQPGGSGGVHNIIHFLEDWSSVDWAFIGSLVVMDRQRYSRGYLGNQDIYNPPTRLYCFDQDLFTQLPPFPDLVNEVFVW